MLQTFSRVRVPASSANLGPGFDALGLGLDLYLECRFRAAAELKIRATGRDSALISEKDDNLIWQTAVGVAAKAGRTMPPIELHIANDIPLGKGLGSSAAALTAGVVIANETLQLGWDRSRILDEAARLEGHPDNVAACVLGAIVASAIDSEGKAQAVRLDLHPHYGVAVVVPDFALSTSKAREVLPATYSRADAVFNVQRSALLIVALATGATSAFPTALEDRIHQPYRFPLVPGLNEISKLRAPGLLGCALSGAGPSILVFHERGHEEVCDLVCAVFKKHGHNSEIVCKDVAHHGYSVEQVTL
ncbi:MAG: homoserine kinase [Acidobacteriota bacterium]